MPQNKNGGLKPPSMPFTKRFTKPLLKVSALLFVFAQRRRSRCNRRRICRWSGRRWRLRIGMHTFFKAANAFANSAPHFRNFLSSEQEDDDRQNDQPVNCAKFSHVYLPSRGRRSNERHFNSPGASLKYNTLVSDPARQVLPIEILEQRNCVFPRHARKFLKCADGKPGAVLLAAFNQRFAQALKSHLMKYQVV